jgi:signal transduction histidine kinase
VLICDQALACDPQLIQTIASALRMFAERAQLLQRLHRQLDELRASRARITEAGDAARRRLERDLHDGAQQRFVLLSMTLASTLPQFGELPGATDLQATVARANNELRQGLAELRELARGIHPIVVTDRGLASAVESLVARMEIPVELAVVMDRLPAAVEVAAYYVVCEALTNVARHAGASRARVSAQAEPGRLVVEVIDDGAGGASLESGSGLRGIADRVAVLGGALYVESPRGRGTRLRAELPCS